MSHLISEARFFSPQANASASVSWAISGISRTLSIATTPNLVSWVPPAFALGTSHRR